MDEASRKDYTSAALIILHFFFLDNCIFLCLFVLPISLNLEIHSTFCFAKITSWIALNFQFCRYFSRVVTTPFTYWKYMMSILYPTLWNKHFHSRTNTPTIMIVGVTTAETDSTVSLEFSRKEFMKRAWLPVTTNFSLRFFCVNVFYNQTYFGRTCITFLLFVCISAYAMKAFLDYVNTVDSDEALYIDFNV